MSTGDLRLGRSYAFVNKTLQPNTSEGWAHAYSHKACWESREQFVSRTIGKGLSFTVGVFAADHRAGDAFRFAQMIALDYDKNVSVAQLLTVPIVRQYAALVYPTASSKPDDRRSRVVFIVDERIEGVNRYKALTTAMAREIPYSIDESSFSPVQAWRGSTNRTEAVYINLNATLPIRIAGALTVDQAEVDYLESTRVFTREAYDPAWGVNDEISRQTFDRLIGEISGATDGSGRHNTTRDRACALMCRAHGQGWTFTPEDAANAIRMAAAANGYTEAHGVKTTESLIRGAIKWGHDHPINAPKPRQHKHNPMNKPQPDQRAEAAELPRVWSGGVPDGARTMLSFVTEATADLYDAVHEAARAGLIDRAAFTLKAVESAADEMGVTVPTLARPIAALVDLGVFCKNTGNKGNDSIVLNLAKNPTGGAPKAVYSLPPIDQQIAALMTLARRKAHELAHPTDAKGVRLAVLADFTEIMISTILDAPGDAAQTAAEINAESEVLYTAPDQAEQRRKASRRERELFAFFGRILRDDYSSPIDSEWRRVHGFRAAYCRALSENRHDEIFDQGYATIGRWIGVSPDTVGKVLKRAAVNNQRGEVEPITFHAPADQVVREIHKFAGERHAKPFAVRVTSDSGRTEQFTYTREAARSAAERAQREPGSRLEVLYQMPNRQRVIADAVPVEPEARQTTINDAPRQPRESVPDVRTCTPVRETGYRSEWIVGQLLLRLEKRGELLINRSTGETARIGCTVRQLVELVIGRRVRAVDPLMAEIASAGGIARVSA